MPNTSARKNILPGLQVPAGLPVELEKFLMAVKEALQGGQGTRGQPKERFVTLEDLERIGLITTMVKNGRGEIKSLNAEGVQTGLGVDFSSSSSTVTSMSDLDDVIVTGAIEGDVLRWRAMASKWQRGIAFDATGVLKDAVIPATVPRFDDVFTDTVNGLVPAPVTPLGYFLKDDGTWSLVISGGGGGGGGTLVYVNTTVEAGDTVDNDTAETDFQSLYTIPADRLEEGHVIRVWAAGVVSNNSGGGTTATLRLKLDGNVILESDAIALNDSTTDAGWTAEAVLVVQDATTLEAQGVISFGTFSRAWANAASLTIDVTIPQDLVLSVEFADADPDITITQRELAVALDGVDALAPADASYIVADDESLDALPNGFMLVEGTKIEFDYSTDNEIIINNTMVDVSGYQIWTSDNASAAMPESQMVVEGQYVEFDQTIDNEVKLDVYPVHIKGAAWSTTDTTTAIDQTKAPEITIPIPWNCWIQEVIVTTVGGAGSCVIDVEKANYATFPTTTSITASAKPTIVSDTKYSDTVLTGWTRAIAAGDVLRFQLESSSAFKQISIILKLKEKS